MEKFLGALETAREQLATELLRHKRIARRSADSFRRTVDRAAIWYLFTQMCEQRNVSLPNTGILEEPCVKSEFLSDFFAKLWITNEPSFSSPLPVETLGSVYEAFLRRPITLARNGPRFDTTPAVRKSGGVFYTPRYIVDYIVEETVGKVLAGKSSREMRELRILDPACGAGRFLLRVYDRIVQEHVRWFETYPHDAQSKIRLTPELKGEILSNCIFGLDIDELAVEVTRLSLYLKLLEDEASPKGARRRLPDTTSMAILAANIRCKNSLTTPSEDHSFDWQLDFPKAFRSGGFDVVLGNPPYGAKLTPERRSRLARHFNARTTETAALMILHASRTLTRRGGLNGFIVPKAFTYSSNWREVRAELLSEMTSLVDVGKVWPEVKLEQVIYTLQKGLAGKSYLNLKRNGQQFENIAVIEKQHCQSFGFVLNGILREELEVGLKIRRAGTFLSDYVSNSRGAMFQDQISTGYRGRRVIGGKQIQRFRITNERGFISSKVPLDKSAFVTPQSILVQNIIAHIAKPVDHIKITAAAVDERLAAKIVILDTVNQLTNRSKLSPYFFLAILNSRLMNWYVYRFIYAKAIRTMHFDGPVTSRIPIPRITLRNQQLYEEIVTQAKALCVDEALEISFRCESALHRLYELSTADIAVIESGMPSFERQNVSAAAVRP